MGEPIAVLALRRKRDLISGTIAKYEKLILAAQHDLAHVNSALRLFEVGNVDRSLTMTSCLRCAAEPPT
jgi:hypothetical protein